MPARIVLDFKSPMWHPAAGLIKNRWGGPNADEPFFGLASVCPEIEIDNIFTDEMKKHFLEDRTPFAGSRAELVDKNTIQRKIFEE